MDKEVQKLRELAKAFREMADATDKVADVTENPDRTGAGRSNERLFVESNENTRLALQYGTIELAPTKAGLIEVYNGGQQS